MINQQLTNYIKEQLQQGIDPQTIKNNLIKGGGWDEVSINESFSAAQPAVNNVSPNNIPQNNSNTITVVKYAGFWIRFVASILDGFITGVMGSIFGIILGLISYFVFHINDAILGILGFLFGSIIGYSYYIYFTYKKEATLGKKVFGLVVQSADGQKLSFGQVFLRETVGKLLSAIILLIGYIMAGFTEKKQSLHDKLAKTVVVYKKTEVNTGSKVAIIIAVVVFVGFVGIAILGILSSVVLASLNTARELGADAKTKSSLNIIRAEAEVYFDENNSYSQSESCTEGVFAGAKIQESLSLIETSQKEKPKCFASNDSYAVSSSLKAEGGGYCVDSSGDIGYAGEGVAVLKDGVAACENNELGDEFSEENPKQDVLVDLLHTDKQKFINELVAQLKSKDTFPVKIDDKTDLQDVTAEVGAIKYHYRLLYNNSDFSKEFLDSAFKEMERNNQKKVCEKMTEYLNYGVKYQFEYIFKSGESLLIEVDKEDCNN